MNIKIATSESVFSYRPDRAGEYLFSDGDEDPVKVLVTESPASGRMCKELKMGGSALCGFENWSGFWWRNYAS